MLLNIIHLAWCIIHVLRTYVENIQETNGLEFVFEGICTINSPGAAGRLNSSCTRSGKRADLGAS